MSGEVLNLLTKILKDSFIVYLKSVMILPQISHTRPSNLKNRVGRCQPVFYV